MPVEWRPETSQLHLHNGQLSHVMQVLPSGRWRLSTSGRRSTSVMTTRP